MSEPLTIGLASTAVNLVNGTIGLLKEARQAAKESDDHDLKDKLSEVFDSVLSLKEVIGDLKAENAELRERLETKASVVWDSEHKLYYAENDEDPFCPVCMETTDKLIRLYPAYANDQIWKYDCRVCKNYYLMQD